MEPNLYGPNKVLPFFVTITGLDFLDQYGIM
jgi:hypothetical protein